MKNVLLISLVLCMLNSCVKIEYGNCPPSSTPLPPTFSTYSLTVSYGDSYTHPITNVKSGTTYTWIDPTGNVHNGTQFMFDKYNINLAGTWKVYASKSTCVTDTTTFTYAVGPPVCGGSNDFIYLYNSYTYFNLTAQDTVVGAYNITYKSSAYTCIVYFHQRPVPKSIYKAVNKVPTALAADECVITYKNSTSSVNNYRTYSGLIFTRQNAGNNTFIANFCDATFINLANQSTFDECNGRFAFD